MNAETQPDFARAVAAYEMAQSDLEGLGEDYSNDELDLYGNANWTAREALLLAPASDFPALISKMEVFASEDCFMLNHAEELFAALIADVRRLGGVQ
ncbi:MAG TPA: hypothetical protein VM711_07365 [Sphingomicrobium sp.]|nr:hypothetical protein [Sphingomicrobium sp.]